MSQQTVVNIPITDHDNFSFAECLVFLGRSEKECLHYVEGGVVQKMIVSNGQPVLVEISDDAASKALRVTVRSTGDRANDLNGSNRLKELKGPRGLKGLNDLSGANELSGSNDLNGSNRLKELKGPRGLQGLNDSNDSMSIDEVYIRRYISHWLHLDADLRSFYDFAAKDTVLASLAARYKGLRLIGIPDLFEALTWSITGQQITLGFAYTLRQRFIQAFGHHAVIDGKDHYVYPHPSVIAALEPASLISMQFSRSKADYIIRLAQSMTDGHLTAEQLENMDYQQAREHLISFRGIGNWSANYVLMKYHRHYQALPLEDAGLHNALKYQLQLSSKPSLADVKTYTQHWKEHAAYATFYLWRSLY
ncbi:DNA-3-methyladenine glycosylase [Chitinophaga sp. CF418]|uniref:DNA-3-methyladenine glycosylase family protein n=1 Tax=Chitinophaga sp. CF418 TaxID=1855287 RepID=UPI0009214181|nr:DNA-3-methyladenine glycosylase [Chitinophaga sp. CF418]SHN45326.1 3-methyladenine DNA glycosylase/8-oxoguanine DNA glycosylase [Chitinophaga sp. CF418]